MVLWLEGPSGSEISENETIYSVEELSDDETVHTSNGDINIKSQIASDETRDSGRNLIYWMTYEEKTYVIFPT